jgi:S-formylglutathione hydrolase FrmB
MPEVVRSFYTDMKYGQKFFTYVSEELPAICRSVFNITSERENTAVIGASIGGYGALKCALSKPEQYGFCGAFSSACLFLKEGLESMRSPEAVKEVTDAFGEQLVIDFKAIYGEQLEWSPRNDILELAKKVSQQSIQPKIYYACGTEDFFHADSLRFWDEMSKLNLDFTYDEWPGGHDWIFFNEAIRRALEFVEFGQGR